MKIVIKEGPNSGQEVDLEGSTVVGRDPASAQLVIDDPEASRRHASIEPAAGGAVVEDLGSTNGTFVNGQRIQGAQEVREGDEIRIGTTVFGVQGGLDVTQMSPIPEPADADATAIGSPLPDAAPEAAPQADHGGAAEPSAPDIGPPDDAVPAAPQADYGSPPAPAPASEGDYGAPPEPAPAAPEPPPAPDFGTPPPPPEPSYEEPTQTVPPAFGGQPDAAPQGGFASDPPPPPSGGPPPPPAGGAPPPPGAGQGFGSPDQAYAPAPGGGYGYGQPGGAMVAGGYGPGGGIETRDSTKTWILCALVPFYAIYHFHRSNNELQAWSGGRIDYNAGASLSALILGGFLFGIPIFVAIASFMRRVRTAQQMAGVQPQASFWGFLLRNFLFGYGWKWLQDQYNELAVRQPQG